MPQQDDGTTLERFGNIPSRVIENIKRRSFFLQKFWLRLGILRWGFNIVDRKVFYIYQINFCQRHLPQMQDLYKLFVKLQVLKEEERMYNFQIMLFRSTSEN